MILDCQLPTFARRFSSASMATSVAPLTAYPVTFACWFNANATTGQTLMGIGLSSDPNETIRIRINSSKIEARIKSSASAITTTNIVTGHWMHACGVFESNTSRAAYLNGGSKGTNATNVAFPTGPNRARVGNFPGSSSEALNGSLAWPAIWSEALTDAEVARLARGEHPTAVRPNSLIAFWDFRGTEIEPGLRSAFPLTNSSSAPIAAPGFLRTRIARPWLTGVGAQAIPGIVGGGVGGPGYIIGA